MKNIDIKKIIIVLVIFIVGYFIFSFLFNNKDKTQSIDELTTFFPFNSEEGGGFDEKGTLSGDTLLSNNGAVNDSIPVLRQITNAPTAGATIFKEVASPTTPPESEEEGYEEKINYIIRYIEKATGHIYETTTDSLTQIRISNTTIPQIQEAFWLDNDSLIIRYLDENDTIKTFSAELITDDLGEQKLEGTFLQDDIGEIIKFGEQIFYLLESGTGSIGIVSDKDDKNKKIIFDSSLKEWLLTDVDGRYINFTTKPAITTPGFSFLFDTKTNGFDKVIGEKSNFSSLMNKSFDILYSEYDKLGPKLYLYSNKEKISTEIPFKTFPEKCVWDKENIFIYCGVPLEELSNYDLTRWYQGLISFSDDIWKINTKTNTTEFLISPREFEVGDIDIINPILNEEENYLLFINKKDNSLWNLKLKKDLF